MLKFLIVFLFLFCTTIFSQTTLAEQTYNASVTTGEICYWTGVEWDEADATAAGDASYGLLGIAIGNSKILLSGGMWRTTGLVAKDIYYLSTTAGQITNTAPSATTNVVRIIGRAYTTQTLVFNVSEIWVVLE